MLDRNLLKLAGMRGVLGALVLLALLQAGCIAGQALGLTGAVCALWEGADVPTAAPSIALFAACFALLQLIRFAQETMLDRYSRERAEELRDDLLARVFDSGEMLSLRLGAARVTALANDGVDEVQTYLRIIPPKLVGMIAISAPLLVLEFAVDWVSGIILVVMFPVTIFFMRLIGQQARERSERQYAVYTRLTGRFMDTLRGLPVLKAFGASEVEAEKVHANSEAVRRATVQTLRMATLSGAVLDFCATFGVAAVAIMLAFRLMDGSLPLSTGLLALLIAPEFFTPIRAYASDHHASLDGRNALGETPQHLGDVVPAVELTNVSYRYSDGAIGVEGISLSATAPEKIGIIGKSGSGKSTLANLLAGFTAPIEGRIVTSDGWDDCVRYIPQEPYIFRATLADNIRFYRPDATIEEVEAAVLAVGLDALVAELPEGIGTLVGEGGRGLSGGEAHRVALARVLIDERARVLVFDEPTAHLDIETERDLKGPMLAAMEGRLVLFATHRLHWMDDMDRVIVLDGGRIVEQGAIS